MLWSKVKEYEIMITYDQRKLLDNLSLYLNNTHSPFKDFKHMAISTWITQP